MRDAELNLTQLRRPSLLVTAARHHLTHKRKSRHTDSKVCCESSQSNVQTSANLRQLEATLDKKRREQAADYDVQRHIAVLSALMSQTQDGFEAQIKIK